MTAVFRHIRSHPADLVPGTPDQALGTDPQPRTTWGYTGRSRSHGSDDCDLCTTLRYATDRAFTATGVAVGYPETADDDGKITFTVTPTRSPDVQLSWIMIAAG